MFRLLEYESCEKLHRDIMEQMSLRSRETRTSEKYARLSATVRMRLKQYNNEVDQLRVKLQEAARSKLMYPFTLFRFFFRVLDKYFSLTRTVQPKRANVEVVKSKFYKPRAFKCKDYLTIKYQMLLVIDHC